MHVPSKPWVGRRTAPQFAIICVSSSLGETKVS